MYELSEFMDAIDAGTPVISFWVSDGVIAAVKCMLIEGYFKELGRLSVRIEKNEEKNKEEFEQFAEFLGKRPLLCGYGSKKMGLKYIKDMHKQILDMELTPYIHLDIKEIETDLAMTDIDGLKSLADHMEVSAGLSFNEPIGNALAIFRIVKKIMDMPVKNFVRVHPRKTAYWESPNKKIKRIYISTVPAVKVFYDIGKEQWVCSNQTVDLEKLVDDVFTLEDVKNVQEFIKKISPQL